METFSVLLTIVLGLICKYIHSLWSTMTYFKSAGIPYVQPLPLVGNIGLTLINRLHFGEVLKNLYDRFPDARYMGFYDCMTPSVLIRDSELIKSIAITNFDHFTDNYGFTTEVDPLFYNTLFQLKGRRWREMRSLLSPSFTSSKLKQMFNFVSKNASDFVDDLATAMNDQTGEVEMKDLTSRFTNDVICKFAFGIDVDSTKNHSNVIHQMGKRTFDFDGPLSMRMFLLKNFRMIVKLFRIKLFDTLGTKFFKDLIKSVVEARTAKETNQQDMLQSLINAMDNPDAKVKVSMDDCYSNSFIFFFGGFDTTSSYLSFAVYILARQPEIQEKLRAEIDRVLADSEGNPSYDDIQNMKYMNCVVCEVGRLYGPVAYVEKKCTKRFELPPAMPGLKSLVVEPGANICFPIFALHRDPKYFPEPEKFDPERFVENNIGNDSGFYLPFGLGPRACIGIRLAIMEIKVMVFHLLARCNLKMSRKSCGPVEFVKSSFIVMPRDGFWVEIEKRSKHRNL